MSIKIQKLLLENSKKGMQTQFAMVKKADEMIGMMQLVKKDAKKRAWQYNLMVRALEDGRLQEAKNYFREMQSWKRYKINF